MSYLSVVRANNTARRRRRRSAMMQLMALDHLLQQEFRNNPRGPYCRLNGNTGVVRVFFGDGDLKKDFRLSRQTVNALVHTLEVDCDGGWGRTLEVAIFLYWLASATSYRVVAEAFDVPRTTVHDVVHRIAMGILHIVNRAVRFPSAENLEEVGVGFARLCGTPAMNRVAGSIDCTHIRVKPPAAYKRDYYNRKLFHSMQFQAICDHRGIFLNVFTGLPGSVHDARVLRWSSVYVHQLYPPPGWYLIGDGGYPCLSAPICLMVPFREPVQNAAQARFNRHLSTGRCVVERAFGMMKTRWRSIFLKALEVKITFAPVVMSCCAFLHNLSYLNDDWVEPAAEFLHDDPGEDGEVHVNQPGDNFRNHLVADIVRHIHPALRDHDY